MLVYVGNDAVVDAGRVALIAKEDVWEDRCEFYLAGDPSPYQADMPWRDLAEVVQGAPFVELDDGLLVARAHIVSVSGVTETKTEIATVDGKEYIVNLPYDTVKKLIGARVVATPAALAHHEGDR